MFKKIIAALLLLTFVIQTFSAPFIRLDYYLNTTAYARDCVNKAQKNMHCNGKCQMMKKILAQEKKQTQDAEHKLDNKVEVLSSKSFFTAVTPVFFNTLQTTYFIKDNSLVIKMPRAFFHPPTV
jgi:hypothetical protein